MGLGLNDCYVAEERSDVVLWEWGANGDIAAICNRFILVYFFTNESSDDWQETRR
jgi:hypothetical protein